MSTLLKANKVQADSISSLKESLNDALAKCKELSDARDNWAKEKDVCFHLEFSQT